MGDKESLWEPTTRSYFQAWESKPTPQEPRLVTGTCLLSSAMYLLLGFQMITWEFNDPLKVVCRSGDGLNKSHKWNSLFTFGISGAVR